MSIYLEGLETVLNFLKVLMMLPQSPYLLAKILKLAKIAGKRHTNTVSFPTSTPIP